MPDFVLECVSLPDESTFRACAAGLAAPIDSFLEDTILESDAYRILVDGVAAGCVAHSGKTLTLFHLDPAVRKHGWAIWDELVDALGVETALASSYDGFLLGHALHGHQAVSIQALFFQGRVPTPAPADAPPVSYRPATLEDIPALEAVGEDIVDDRAARIAEGDVHVGFLEGELVAVGLAIPSRVWTGQASLGMFTAEGARRRGIGAQTIRYLIGVCRKRDMLALAGCPYGHTASRATLQAAGMIPDARLLRILL